MRSKTIGILAGAFNPLTRAHLALIEAGLNVADEVICVVPRLYPHKQMEGARMEQRLEMLRMAGGHFSVATTRGGLFQEIAGELRANRPDAAFEFLCGRDAAERVLNWNYGPGHSIEAMLREFGLLVAARQGEFVPPARLAARVRPLPMEGGYDDHSSTEVRRRVAGGEPWEHLVPQSTIEMVGRIYAARSISVPV